MARPETRIRPLLAHVFLSALLCSFAPLLACSSSDEPRCALCGMDPARHPRWRSSAELADGSKLEFCSPHCLLRFLHDPGRHRRGASVDERGRIRVVEYYSQRAMDARSLHYVKGSDVVGAMGPDYVPVRGLDKARQFKQDHGGQGILTFDEAVRSPP